MSVLETRDTLSTVHQLSTVTAAAAGLGQRGLPKGATVYDQVFWDQYDNDTLIYDTVWSAEQRQLRVFFPKLCNLKKPMRAAQWTLDGKACKASRIKPFRVYDCITIPCNDPAAALDLYTAEDQCRIPVSPADADRYRGRNVLYALNKDNDLAWICDWVAAHQRNHGVDAVLLGDNGSKTYSSADLRRTLAEIPGIAVADVLDAPLRYGPNPKTATPVGDLKFLQRAFLNIVKDRWLQQARGVLICDIDELVVSSNGQSIFDATAKAIFKYTSFSGSWRYRPPTPDDACHADHIYTASPPALCTNKYCIVPDSALGRMSWGVHALEGINRRVLPASRIFSYYHCRSISTSWKNNRAQPPMEKLQRDQATETFMENSFPAKRTTDATS
ncbi:MAG: hypothetical protein AAFX89_01880 [Pseudomonadota bacterium]